MSAIKAKLSVIIPVFNEVSTILRVIQAVKKNEVKNIELIVVDDGSTDGTQKILKQNRHLIDKLVLKQKNRGKGAALNTGIRYVTGDIVIFQDADLEYSPTEYATLIAPILSGKADVVYGSRFIGGQAHRVVYFWHYFANILLTLATNIVANINLSDMETGYKVFKTEVLQKIKITERSFGVEPEITIKVAKQNWRMYEVGISYHGRTYEEGKKITWQDAARALLVIVKFGWLN